MLVGSCQGLECCKQRGEFPHDVHFSIVLKILCINIHTQSCVIGMGIQAVYKRFTVQPSSLCHKAGFFNGVNC